MKPDHPRLSDRRTDRRDQHHITGLQSVVESPISSQVEIREIQCSHALAIAHHLDLAQRSEPGRAAGGIQRVGRRRQRTDFIGARANDFAHDKHLDRPDAGHRYM